MVTLTLELASRSMLLFIRWRAVLGQNFEPLHRHHELKRTVTHVCSHFLFYLFGLNSFCLYLIFFFKKRREIMIPIIIFKSANSTFFSSQKEKSFIHLTVRVYLNDLPFFFCWKILYFSITFEGNHFLIESKIFKTFIFIIIQAWQ